MGKPSPSRPTPISDTTRKIFTLFSSASTIRSKVRARMSRREDIYDDDQVEIMLDTFHDRRRAYAFQTTPLGVQWDAIWTEASREEETQGHFDTSFDTVWDSRGKVTGRGFVVWMAIPFKSLRFPATKVQEWGIILYRGITRKTEDSFWPHIYLQSGRPARPGRHTVRAGRNFSRPRHRTDSVRRDARFPRARHPRFQQSLFSESHGPGPARHGREVRHPRPLHARRHRESRLQPGRVGRPADHRQPALCRLLPREAPFLPGERRFFPHADGPVFHAQHRRSFGRNPPDRKRWAVFSGRDERRRSQPRARRARLQSTCPAFAPTSPSRA